MISSTVLLLEAEAEAAGDAVDVEVLCRGCLSTNGLATSAPDTGVDTVAVDLVVTTVAVDLAADCVSTVLDAAVVGVAPVVMTSRCRQLEISEATLRSLASASVCISGP